MISQYINPQSPMARNCVDAVRQLLADEPDTFISPRCETQLIRGKTKFKVYAMSVEHYRSRVHCYPQWTYVRAEHWLAQFNEFHSRRVTI